MPNMLILSGLVAAAFALVHIFGIRLKFLDVTPRSIWLSAAGGVSVAYVFVHLIPELAEYQERFADALEDGSLLARIERHSYLIALAGLVVFYGLDRLARQSARGAEQAGRGRRASGGVFWIHLVSFAAFNFLIGYLLLHREENDLLGLVTYAVAMTLHFVVNDYGLREQHGQTYHDKGRWILAAAPVTGWALGLATTFPPLLTSTLFAFIAGGIVLNVLKEELPEDRESRFSAFAAGAACYTALLLTTG